MLVALKVINPYLLLSSQLFSVRNARNIVPDVPYPYTPEKL